jgi:5-methyltetrahydrofolate--homocysteine methyltransferase
VDHGGDLRRRPGSDPPHLHRGLTPTGERRTRTISFGNPACPNLADQRQLLALLDASRIGVELSDEDQLWPEQSTSAIVLHHPQARYFNV